MFAPNPILIDLPVPILTPRLLIRDPRPGDGAELFAARKESDAELRPWMPFARGVAPTLEECEANVREAHARFILRQDLRLIILDRATGTLIANSGLHRFDFGRGIFEIGYWVRSPMTGRGYVSEAVNAITRYAFGVLDARRVAIHCNADNRRSRAVAERLGFSLEARLANADQYADESVASRDHLIFAMCNPNGLPPLDVRW